MTFWRISPRDPLVAGDGGPWPAVGVQKPNPLPPQATIAGFVRAALVQGGPRLTDAEAAQLLQVSVRGPLLSSRGNDGAHRFWVPAPADAAALDGTLQWAELIQLERNEGVNAFELTYLVHLPAKHGGKKLKSPVRPKHWLEDAPYLWPFDAAVSWALGDSIGAAAALFDTTLQPPIRFEPRVHVGIQDDTGTADPAMLFTTPGWRYDDAQSAGLVVEVGDPNGRKPPSWGVLGGESRVSHVETGGANAFPSFAFYKARYEDAWRNAAGDAVRMLRVTLLTPGAFDGALPNAPAGLELRAASVSGARAVSGWNMFARGPRAIRRLAPAGSVYHFGPIRDKDHWLDLCQDLWLKPLVPGQADPNTFLAAPGDDGYGLALPGLTLLPRGSP